MTVPSLPPSSARPELYDPPIPGPSSPFASSHGGSPTSRTRPPLTAGMNPKTAAIHAQISETVEVMRNSINMVAERGESLESLQTRTENLVVSARGFRRSANRVRKNMWWKDMKMRIIIGVSITIIITLIIISVVQAIKRSVARQSKDVH